MDGTSPAVRPSDPSHDFLRSEARPLDAIFKPRSVAVIGATDREETVDRTVLSNLLHSGFHGNVYAVNPSHTTLLGAPCYPNVAALPEKLDLAVVVTPARTVPGVIGECVDAGVGAAVVISAGFKERGPEGAELERQIQEQLGRGNLRLVGPNCLGVMNPFIGLNATFARDMARPGNVAFFSQSGALLAAILDWSLRELVGFSAIVSTGSMLDVSWGDLLDYFGDDPHTQSILLYMESIGDARSFVSAAREVALTKPIILIKAGRTEEASHAASSHTGALTGSDAVLDAAFRRCGVLRVNTVADLFYMAEVLSKQPRPRGPRLAILTNAGGPGVLATDSLITNGGELAPLAPETLAALDQLLPPHWSHGNPIDLLGDADPERYARALEIAAADPTSDGLLAILVPQGMNDPKDIAERLTPYAKGSGKPLLASLMGGAGVAVAEALLNRSGIPTFNYPDTAARAFDFMWRYTYNLRGIYETPAVAEEVDPSSVDRSRVDKILWDAMRSGRTLLTEIESKQILAHYGLPTVEMRLARDADEAARQARELGFPVVLKVHSETLTHKTDVGGVQLDLSDENAVRRAYRAMEASIAAKAGAEHFQGVTVQPMVRHEGYELIFGSSVDPQFGPVILFGAGGQLVELFGDRALALPPLNTTLARRLMEQTRIHAALRGVRGRKPVDVAEVERLLVRFSLLVIELPRIKEIDINPLLAAPEGIIALDARIVLHPPEVADEQLPRPAVRPYPVQYVSAWLMKDGTEITIRPIRPEDEPLMVKFHATLSERSVYLRYFHMANLSTRIAHSRLIRICFIDYDREMALVAVRKNPDTGEDEIIAVGRLSKQQSKREGEWAILVSDQYQRRGLGTELLRRLIHVARDEKLERITAQILSENIEMQTVAKRLGFKLRMVPEESMELAVIEL